MKKAIVEESILIASVIKWVFLASCTGLIVGMAATAFLSLLSLAINKSGNYHYAFLFLPLAFFLSAILTRYLAPDAEGHGTEKVIEAIHRQASKIPLAVVPVKLLATIITLAIGGSAGKEGPCAQIGAGVSSFFARLLKLDEKDRRKLVICGISAGFATVFGTPIAGSIFGVEVLFVGAILYDVLLPSFIAGVTAYQVSVFFGIPHPQMPVITLPATNEILILKMIMAGIIFGTVSTILISSLETGRHLSEKIKIWMPAKGIIGGTILIILAMIFGQQYLGLGLPLIIASLNGQTIFWATPFLKILFTSITLNFGGSGGIVTPIFFIGATTGAVLANPLHLDQGLLAAIGFVSLLAGAANTPIAASVMAIEIFGPAIGSCAAISCIISYLVSGHRSVYPSQVLAVKKSQSINTECGMEMHSLHVSYQQREHALFPNFLTFWKKQRNRWKH
jgi:H+/Cl- antiporter ClcA